MNAPPTTPVSRYQRPVCPRCGYDLDHLRGGVICPECGHGISGWASSIGPRLQAELEQPPTSAAFRLVQTMLLLGSLAGVIAAGIAVTRFVGREHAVGSLVLLKAGAGFAPLLVLTAWCSFQSAIANGSMVKQGLLAAGALAVAGAGVWISLV